MIEVKAEVYFLCTKFLELRLICLFIFFYSFNWFLVVILLGFGVHNQIGFIHVCHLDLFIFGTILGFFLRLYFIFQALGHFIAIFRNWSLDQIEWHEDEKWYRQGVGQIVVSYLKIKLGDVKLKIC